MLHPLPPGPCCLWHHYPCVRVLVADLGPGDVRLALVRGGPAPDYLEWRPDSTFGAATFDALGDLRQQAVGSAFALARDDCARRVALASAQRAPTVAGVVAGRFGDPRRWSGLGPVDATRRFRANWN